MNSLQVITQLPATKAEMNTFVQSAIEEMLDGTRDPLEINVRLKILEEVIKKIKENPDVKYAVMDEARKYGKSFDKYNAKIVIKSRTTMDYSTCGDPVYDDLKQQEAKLKEVIKAREAMLKSGIDPSTGETFNPPSSSVTEFIEISLP